MNAAQKERQDYADALKKELEQCRKEAQALVAQHNEPYRVSQQFNGHFRVDSHYYLSFNPDLQDDLCVYDDYYPEGW